MSGRDVASKDKTIVEMAQLIVQLDAHLEDVKAGRTEVMTFVRAATNALFIVQNHPHRVDEEGRKNLMQTIEKYRNDALDLAFQAIDRQLLDSVHAVERGTHERSTLIHELTSRLATWKKKFHALPPDFVSRVEGSFDRAIMRLRQYN